MKNEIVLKSDSSKDWLDAVMADFNSFLLDHANCERKASAMAMSFVAKYPDRDKIISDCIATAIEELEHFEQVYQIIENRGLKLEHEITKDMYLQNLLKCLHSGRNERFLDRLLLAALVEARGAERFRLISEALENENLIKFYRMLGISEAKHCHIFIKMASHYFDDSKIAERLEYLSIEEAKILENLDLKAALH